MATRNGNVSDQKTNSLVNILSFLIINSFLAVLFLLGANPIIWGAYLTILVLMVAGGFIGTIFSSKKWEYRFSQGGIIIPIAYGFLGLLIPMVGNWQPKIIDKKTYRSDLGKIALPIWLMYLGILLANLLLGESNLFLSALSNFAGIFVIFNMIPIYPIEQFGGRRILDWNRKIYIALWIISAAILILGFI